MSELLPAQLTNPPLFLQKRSSQWFITSVVTLSIFADIILYSVVVPVLPISLTTRVGIEEDQVQFWTSILLALYGVGLFVASPIVGWISDRTDSRKWPFIFGLVTEAGATVCIAVGTNLTLLCIGRVVQGISDAIVWTVGLVILVDTFGQERTGEAMGAITMAMSLGLMIGPFLGGIVYDLVGYWPTFAICFALLGLDIVLRLGMIERKVALRYTPSLRSSTSQFSQSTTLNPTMEDRSHGQHARGLRIRAFVGEPLVGLNYDGYVSHLEVITVAPSAEAGIRPHPAALYPGLYPEPSISSQAEPDVEARPGIAGEEVVSIRSLTHHSSTVHSIRKRSIWSRFPHVITLLASGRILVALGACLVQSALITAFDAILPLRVYQIFGWDSLGGGLIFIPFIIPQFVAIAVGKWTDKHGPRWLCTGGFAIAGPFLILLRYVSHDTLDQKVLLCFLLFAIGACLAAGLTPIMAEISYCVNLMELRSPPGHYGINGAYAQAYGLYNVAFAVGCLVGPVWGGLVKDSAGWNTVMLSLGLLSMFTAVPCFLSVGGWYMTTGAWSTRMDLPPKDVTLTNADELRHGELQRKYEEELGNDTPAV